MTPTDLTHIEFKQTGILIPKTDLHRCTGQRQRAAPIGSKKSIIWQDCPFRKGCARYLFRHADSYAEGNWKADYVAPEWNDATCPHLVSTEENGTQLMLL